MKISRRHFLGGLATAGAGALASTLANPAAYPPTVNRYPVVDMHVHLFGVLEKNGCWISSTQREHWTHPFLTRLLRIHDAPDQDEAYVQTLVRMLRASSLQKAVLQAWDGRIDPHGRVDRTRTTSLLVPNDYLFAIVRRFPDLFIPCASIHPYRADAIDELNRCADLGARMVKIHPPTMDADPAKPCLKNFYRTCRQRNIVVMVHTGHEHAADIVGLHNCDPLKLELPLEEGCTVIAAHAGTASFFDRDPFPGHFARLIRRYPNLYCDNSVLAILLRYRVLPELLRDSGVVERMVHGSDFPFPPNAMAWWNRMQPRTTARLLQEQNLLERDLQMKRALGVPEAVFERGARLLGLTPTSHSPPEQASA